MWKIWAILMAIAPAAAAADDWSQFRGPNSQGRSDQTDFPTSWDEHEGIAWKTPIPGAGWSSPVTGGGRIWLTTAIKDGHSLRAICVKADNGHVEHDIEVFAPGAPAVINPQNTHASPTPVMDADHVYVHFGAMGTACLKAASGEIVWRSRELEVDHQVGAGSSPILFENLLIANCDGIDQQFVAALDKATGSLVWKTKRTFAKNETVPDYRKAFSTPVLANVAGRTQLVSIGADEIDGYDARTGGELWRVRFSGFSIIPTPLVDRDRVYAVMDFNRPQLWAIGTDGTGDVTNTRVLWKLARQVAASSTPVLLNGRIYMVTDHGVASSVNADDGKLVWQHRLGGTYWASTLALGGLIYFSGESGRVTVVRPASDCVIAGVSQLDGRIFSTPAVLGRSLILRTDTHLYRIDGHP